MTDYTRYTRYGDVVDNIYLVEGTYGNSTILATIIKPDEYMWVWDYRPQNGTWGQGHHNYSSLNEAVRDMKKVYPKAKSVNGFNLVQITNEFGSFGEYADMTKAFKRLYHITKIRGPTLLTRLCNGVTLYFANVDGNRVKCYDAFKHKVSYLNADGKLKPL